MKAALKIISGVGGLCVASPSGYGIYHIWDTNNPTGDARLLSSGYTFNKPTLVRHENPGYSCSENLFSNKKTNIEPNKLYGCAVMKMEKSEDEKFIKFNSEVALRKENKGWIINTLLDNHNRFTSTQDNNKQLYELRFGYVFTEKDLLSSTEKSESWFFWDGTESNSSITKIHLQIPKQEESLWYDSNKLVNKINKTDPAHNQDKISFSSTKDWSGVWISDDSTNNPWIFENLEVWANNKDNSEVFCKEITNSKCSDYSASGSYSSYKVESPNKTTWLENVTSGNSTGSGSSQTKPSATDIRSKIKEMIKSIKDIRGNWMDLNEVCGWRWNRNIDNYQLDKLKMYCSK